MSKYIVLDAVEFTMLTELAKKSRQKPDQYLKTLIRNQYDNLKK
jgi:hypothetical protein